MLRAEKEKIVQELAEKLRRAQGVYLADFTGLDVASITELRRKLRSASVEFRVVKNTLARLAVEQAGVPELRDSLEGPTCLAFGYDDAVAPARVLVDFAKDHERPKIRSGFLEGRVLTLDEVSAVASLPSREQLLSRIVTLAQTPVAGFVSRCRGLLHKCVATVDALRTLRERQGGQEGVGDESSRAC
jgi:large subunit ribosomal protein L10